MQDLPSGYNSGEQYDTISTGYMSGEAYELPETRPEPMEPTLASIDEVSAKSNEELFTIGQPSIYQENSILVQMEHIASSSSSASIPDAGEVTGALETIGIMKTKRAKKQVSYHVSVPIEKSPLGPEGYREIPSDTDTTSCFDSDGTYMRSEGQSSDSGAALLSHSGGRGRRGRERRGPGRGGGRAGLTRKIKKARHVIRSHEDFFSIHDNKFWMAARQACFWCSIVSILGSIVTACIMIGLMPRNCDPDTEWWQGSVIMEVSPSWSSGQARLNLTDLINNVTEYKRLGVQAIKLKNLYRTQAGTEEPSWISCTDMEVIRSRLDYDLVSVLADELHQHGMQLMVELPAVESVPASGMMSLFLIQNVTVAIKTWAEAGVDGISLTGLELFARDDYMAINAESWKIYLNKYGRSPYKKILSASYLLPQHLEETLAELDAGEADTNDGSTEASQDHLTGYDVIASFDMLEANIKISETAKLGSLESVIQNVAHWDQAPSQPWINWNFQFRPELLDQAEFAFHLLLPGTISIGLEEQNVSLQESQQLLSKLIELRKSSVPIFMNGNFKACHAHCDGLADKVDNYKVHLMLNNSLVLLERNFNRRNRYMVIANIANTNSSLVTVASLYSSGEVILDTNNLGSEQGTIKFKDADLPGKEALVIKFPK